ncbi:MAG TPA: endopeptidase La [Myxococcales bacterium]|nr:endopeptidase La [Myxococcales bacterium]
MATDAQPVRSGEELPILPTRGSVTFPHEIARLLVSRPLTAMLGSLTEAEHRVVLVAQRDPRVEEPGLADLHAVGTVAAVLRFGPQPGGGSLAVIAEGLRRVRLAPAASLAPPLRARVEVLEDTPEPADDVGFAALVQTVRNLFSAVVAHSPHLSNDLLPLIAEIREASLLADVVAAHLPWLPVPLRQELLELTDLRSRLERLVEILGKEHESLELQERIRAQVRERFAGQQREAFLREELKTIQAELGERDPEARRLEELRQRIAALPLAAEARTDVDREAKRLQALPAESSEAAVVRTWLDLLVALPWGKLTSQEIDVRQAQKILDQDHDDLAKVKERIVEHLAVQQLRPGSKGPILCFLGPPGVGKTSLGQSIARALGRAFVRVSLGGTHDEAEIRGHRRTYVGALPGQIILGMRRAGTSDPVFMLDEIDKMGRDFHGDPGAALLEALDPEQNGAFRDHYLDVPYDLSRVLFITTANTLETVPPTLLDRMEVLELPGYSEEEKLLIARHHLVPRQIRENGLDEARIRFGDAALVEVIRGYTREAGVRNLERALGRVCRKHARAVAGEGASLLEVTPEIVRQRLGAPAYQLETELAKRTRVAGVAVALAWTPQGGDVLFVEARLLPRGRGEFIVTGQVGEVMQESMRAALSWLRSSAAALGLDPGAFKHNDVHVHVPAGAVHKDGPSAGVAITAALCSLFTGTPVRPFVALTGEITLSGQVLPVGGLKEKVLAARRSGVKEIVLPALNEAQLVEEVPEELRAGMCFHFVDALDQALARAIERRPPASPAAARA